MNYAPIVVFAFNRLEPLKACIVSLQRNNEAAESNLIVFVDGPRQSKEGEKEKVEAVREYVKSITGFKSLNYHFSDINKKLGPSIIAGVTEVMSQYGKAIVVEDDLIVARNFLSFMNQGLDRYEKEKSVFSICGYTNLITPSSDYTYSTYFCTRSSSWGWATWVDRWNDIDWNLDEWNKHKKNKRAFNKWGGSDCWKMLNDWRCGRNQSWAIRFCYNEFIQNKLSLFPIKSLVDNRGFDGNGTNCKTWSRFKFEFDESGNKFVLFPDAIKIDYKLYRQAMSYHTIIIRVWSRIMYLFH